MDPLAKRQKVSVGQLYDSKHNFDQREVAFAANYPTRSFKLIEVPSELVKSIESGEALSIVGKPGSEAVLCSSSKTYGMKRVETSNCVFFVPPSSSGDFSICSSASDYYELRLISPKVDSLRDLLGASSDYPSANNQSGDALSLEAICAQVQASRMEIVKRLLNMGAFELKGCVRVASMQALSEHTQALLETIIASSWASSERCEVDESLCLSSMRASSFAADPVLLQCLLRSWSAPHSATAAAVALPAFSAAPCTWTLDMSKLKLAAAWMLFEEEKQRKGSVVEMSAAEFLLEWRLRAPGMRLQEEVGPEDLALLEGLAVYLPVSVSVADGKSGPAYRYFPADALQQLDAKARLSALFSIKSSFLLKELLPYIDGLWCSEVVVGGPKTPQDLLAPFTRLSPTDGLYTAK